MSETDKVMIAVPTNKVKHYCLGKFVKGINNMEDIGEIVTTEDTRGDDAPMNALRGTPDKSAEAYSDLLAKAGFKVLRVEETLSQPTKPCIRQRLVNARNLLREEFLKSDCTHMLFLDSDIIPPRYTIPDLLRHNVDIVSGVYYQKDADNQWRPVVYRYLDKESWETGLSDFGMPLTQDDLQPSRLVGYDDDDIHIAAIGFGCVLISRKVLEDRKWEFRYSRATAATEDMWWSIDIKNLGYTIGCDTGILCKHYPKPWVGEV